MAGSDDATIDCERADDTVRARVCGEIDLANIEDLRTALDAAADDAMTIELDLSGVTFMDSTGIRWVLEVEQMLQRRDGRIVITKTSPQVWHVFDVTGLVEHFDLRRDG